MKVYLAFLALSFLVTYCESIRSENPNCDFENVKLRVLGGWEHISQLQCESLYSCYDDTIRESYHCFRPNSGKSTNPKCDFSHPQDRKDGGWPGITKLECESLGYCFDNTIGDVNFCILSPNKLSSFNCDFTRPERRIDAGYPGISKEECLQKNGCFDDTIVGSHFCFKHNKGRTFNSKCDFSKPSERIDGGYQGIEKEVCESSGHCFDDTIPNVNWCFKTK